MADYSKALKIIRIEMGLTQAQLASALEISPGSIYKYENNMMEPRAKVLERIMYYCQTNKLDIIEKSLKSDWGADLSSEIEESEKGPKKGDKKEMRNERYESQLEINGLQKDKIKYLEMELQRLKDTKENQLPLWDDISFDVRTYQVFDDTTFTNFKSYDMKHYHDFYQKLGYTSSEAEKYWKITKKMMTNRRDKSTVEQRAFFTDAKAIPQLINFEKTDASVTSVEQVQQHFRYAIRHSITSQLQIYNACYYKKDGSELLAVLSVLYNFTDMSSKSKIKFLEE